ncbi:MAG: hypothetical protein L0Z62_22935 [Gemmataceae bacterium]|nr:hypothetical protein [Gemmataceae bacterium]
MDEIQGPAKRSASGLVILLAVTFAAGLAGGFFLARVTGFGDTHLPHASSKDDPEIFRTKREAIKRVAEQARADSSRRAEARKEPGQSSPVANFKLYVAQLWARNLSGCPDDFWLAFERTIEARRQCVRVAITFEKEIPSLEEWSRLANLLPREKSTEVEKAVQAAEKASDEAGKELRRIAFQYGVDYQRAELTPQRKLDGKTSK